MPRATAEAVANEEDANENRNGESCIRGNSTNREDGTNGDGSTEDEEQEANSNASVEPHGIHGSKRILIDSLDPEGSRKATITSIGKSDSGSSNHAALTHGETTNESESQNSECSILR